jgi:hypothetical protein
MLAAGPDIDAFLAELVLDRIGRISRISVPAGDRRENAGIGNIVAHLPVR